MASVNQDSALGVPGRSGAVLGPSKRSASGWQKVWSGGVSGLLVILMTAISGKGLAQEQPTAGEVFSEFLACEAVPDPTEQLICFRTALKKYKRRFGLLSGRVEDVARDNPAALPTSRRLSRKGERRVSVPPLASASTVGGTLAPPPSDSPKAQREYRRALAEATPKRVEGVIVEAHRDPLGYWIFTLDNGQVWKEASGARLSGASFAGKHVKIRKGLLGSWYMTIAETHASGRVVRVH